MRGGRGPGRIFETGDLRFLILQHIAEKPSYGYEVMKAIEAEVAGAYAPSPGVIYPTLTMLEDLGYIAVESTEGSRKRYSVTAAGRDFLKDNRETVAGIESRMSAVREAHGGGPSPEIRRAMENLKLALRLRVANGPLTRDQLRKVVDAIDAAAVAIERI
jgi:DNA-binding PadR family transcriptional regulator